MIYQNGPAAFMQYSSIGPQPPQHAVGDRGWAFWTAARARLSDIAQHMPGTATANYKAIQRFIANIDVKAALLRLFQDDAEFVIGDALRCRPTAGVSDQATWARSGDGETATAIGCWSWPHLSAGGRWRVACSVTHLALWPRAPAHATCATGRSSMNSKPCWGDKPLVLDRDFSYLEAAAVLACTPAINS